VHTLEFFCYYCFCSWSVVS